MVEIPSEPPISTELLSLEEIDLYDKNPPKDADKAFQRFLDKESVKYTILNPYYYLR